MSSAKESVKLLLRIDKSNLDLAIFGFYEISGRQHRANLFAFYLARFTLDIHDARRNAEM